MDSNDLERVDVNALGGPDTIIVNSLAGTDVTEVNINLGIAVVNGDSQIDSVIVDGTLLDDVIVVAGDANGVSVIGLPAIVNIRGAEASNDRLTVKALAGDDVIDASGVTTGAIALTLDGGDDDDVLIGSDAVDMIFGGAGDDVLIGGPAIDFLDGGPGSNVVIQ